MSKRWTMKGMMGREAIACMGICLFLLAAGCGTAPEPTSQFGWQIGGCVGQESALTEQTEGFDETCEVEKLLPAEVDYCTEKIFWEYDQVNQTLQLVHGPVVLNCCGVRQVRTGVVEGFHTIVEVDEPGDYRCRCMCDTFYSVCMRDVPPATLPVRIFLHVTDASPTPIDVWEGELDLSEDSGEIVLGESGSYTCME
jgi:hypothetical protein